LKIMPIFLLGKDMSEQDTKTDAILEKFGLSENARASIVELATKWS